MVQRYNFYSNPVSCCQDFSVSPCPLRSGCHGKKRVRQNDGRFIFNETTEKHFTDYFKQLIGWGKQQDNDTPRFFRGEAALRKYFVDKKFELASDTDEADTVVVSLVINEDGNPLQPNIEKCPEGINESRLLADCRTMPKWFPAYKDGKPYSKDVQFYLRVPKLSMKVFDVADKMPSFPGGNTALMEYLANSIKYPIEAEENGIQGRVVCTFIVERDGSISDVRVMKSVHPLLDKEAVRVVLNMPPWVPGQWGGYNVRVKYTMPVTFHLTH